MKNKHSHTTSNNEFEIPEGFFEEFSDSMLSKVKDIKTDKLHLDSGFELPENFYNTSQKSILEKVNSKKHKVISLFTAKTFKRTLFAAASILLFFALITNTKISNTSTSTPVSTIIDSVKTLKKHPKKEFSITSEDTNMLALFVDDSNVDEHLDIYLLENMVFSD